MSLPNPKTKKVSDPAGTAGKGQGKELKPTTPLPGPNGKVQPTGKPIPGTTPWNTGIPNPASTPAPNQMVIKDPNYKGPVGPVPSDTGTRGKPTQLPPHTFNPKTVDTYPVKPSGPPLPGPNGKVQPTGTPIPGATSWNTGIPKPGVLPGSSNTAPGVQPMTGGVNTITNTPQGMALKKGGRVKAKAKSSYSSGGKVSSASKRGDGCAQRGKTKGRMV